MPFAGVAVYVWHCDREGRYSLYSQGVTDQNYLRGVQVADADGRVTLHQHLPGLLQRALAAHPLRGLPRPGRHHRPDERDRHVAGRAAAGRPARPSTPRAGYEASVSNLAQVSLDSDNVFGDDGGASQLGTVTGDVDGGYTVSLAVAVDTSTAPTGGSAPGGGPGGGGGQPPERSADELSRAPRKERA